MGQDSRNKKFKKALRPKKHTDKTPTKEQSEKKLVIEGPITSDDHDSIMSDEMMETDLVRSSPIRGSMPRNIPEKNEDLINQYADYFSNKDRDIRRINNKTPVRFSLRRTSSKAAQDLFESIAKKASSRKKEQDRQGSSQCNDDFKSSFDLFDRDRDGTITVEEIGLVLKTLGQSATEDEIAEIIAEIDTDGDGKISLEEFKTLMHRLMESHEFHDNQFLEETFKDFDVFGDGYIGREDLRVVFRKLGDDEISNEEIDEMLQDATHRTNKKVDLEEFRAVVRGNIRRGPHMPARYSRHNLLATTGT